MNLRLLSLSLVLLSSACADDVDALADDGAPMTDSEETRSSDTEVTGEEGEDTSEADTSTPPDMPEPAWERFFAVDGIGSIHDLDVAANGDIVLLQYDESGEESLGSIALGLTENGESRWTTILDIVPQSVCVTASGVSYFLGAPWQEGLGLVQELHLKRLESDGSEGWTVQVAADLGALTQVAGLECRDTDDAALVVGNSYADDSFLALIDPQGMEVSRSDNPVPESQLASVALRSDGYLLVGGIADAGTHSESTVNYLTADGSAVLSYALEGVLAMGPWVASREESAAIVTMQAEDGDYRLTVAGLADHQETTPIWTSMELGGTPNAMGRALAIGEDGRTHATAPNDEGSVMLVSYPGDGIGELTTLRTGQEETAAPSTLGVGRTGEVLIGGSIDGTPWIAAYDI